MAGQVLEIQKFNKVIQQINKISKDSVYYDIWELTELQIKLKINNHQERQTFKKTYGLLHKYNQNYDYVMYDNKYNYNHYKSYRGEGEMKEYVNYNYNTKKYSNFDYKELAKIKYNLDNDYISNSKTYKINKYYIENQFNKCYIKKQKQIYNKNIECLLLPHDIENLIFTFLY
jgi:hypothetical protein